jgi:signal transduction histidine kinase
MLGEVVERALGAHERERQAHAGHARELVELSGEIAHELKNPLASIKGLAALLARDVEAGKAAERLTVLMQVTLDEFLNFSRPLAPITRVPVALGALADEVVAVCEGVARARGVVVDAEVGAVSVSGDERKLRQLLVNLVQNAIEASPQGSRVDVVAAAGDPVRIEVRDRGAGLAPGVDPFGPGVTTKVKGSGLGLTIARALVQQHGGAIALVPRDGGGTVARVELPAI